MADAKSVHVVAGRETSEFAMPTLLLAFDPGITTGVAFARCNMFSNPPVIEPLYGYEVPFANRFEGIKSALQLAALWLPAVQAIVIESYRLYPHRATAKIGSDFPEIRNIGIIEAYAYDFGLLDHFVWQPASSAKGLRLPDDWVVANEYHSQHVRDAFAHLRYWWLSVTNKARVANRKRDPGNTQRLPNPEPQDW